jgi:hypothetical protein
MAEQPLRKSARGKQPSSVNRNLGYISPPKNSQQKGKGGPGGKSDRPLKRPGFIPPPPKGD